MNMNYLGEEEKITYPDGSPCAVFLLGEKIIWRVNCTCDPVETFRRLEAFRLQKNRPWLYQQIKNDYVVVQHEQHTNNIEVWIHTQIRRGSRPRFPVVFTDYFDSLPALEEFLEIRYGNIPK